MRKSCELRVLSLGCVLLSACGQNGSGSSDGGTSSGASANGGESGGGGSGTGSRSNGGSTTGGGGSSTGASGGEGGDGGLSSGGRSSTGGAASGAGGEETGGAGAGTATGGTSGSCDEDFSCPDRGECYLEEVDDGCLRVCEFVAELETDEEVAAVSALGCEVFEGSVLVGGTVGSVAGLETLRSISGTLQVEAESLQHLDALGGLKSVGTLGISGATSLRDVALTSLESIEQGLSVIDCPEVAEVDLGALRTVGSNLAISGNASLLTLHELPSLTTAPNIAIQGNPLLPQCEVVSIVMRTGASCGLCNGNDNDGTCD